MNKANLGLRGTGAGRSLAFLRYVGPYDCDVSSAVGDYSGVGIPWTDFFSRDECIEFFLRTARRHFGFAPVDDASHQKQVQSEMKRVLSPGLFGFSEPAPSQEYGEQRDVDDQDPAATIEPELPNESDDALLWRPEKAHAGSPDPLLSPQVVRIVPGSSTDMVHPIHKRSSSNAASEADFFRQLR